MISTGFPDLDRLIGGWEPGEFIVLFAHPAMGKTSLLLSFLEAAARDNEHAALLYSLEATAEEVDRRLLSHLSSIPLTALVSPDDLQGEDRKSLEEARDELDALLLLVNDSRALTVSDLHGWILFEKASLDNAQFRLTLIAVDYLQLMQGSEDTRTRHEEMSEILRDLKALSRHLDVPLIVTAQLPRIFEQRDDRRPVLADLGYLGPIEQEPDKVIFLYHDEYYDPDSDDAGTAEVIVAKNAGGPTGTVRLLWHAGTRRFLSLHE